MRLFRRSQRQRILVMQPTQHRIRENDNTVPESMSGTQFHDRHGSVRRIRHPRTQALVRPAEVVMARPFFEYRSQMTFGHRDQPVQALPPDCPDHPPTYRVRLGTSKRCPQHLQPQYLNGAVQVSGKDAIAIMNQVPVSSSFAIRSSPHTGFSEAILRISVRSSAGIGGRPSLHLNRQNNRHPVRCQRMIARRRTITTASCQSNKRVRSARPIRVTESTRRGLTPRSMY